MSIHCISFQLKLYKFYYHSNLYIIKRKKRITPVFIFDEANYMKSGILNDLKILFNFEMDSKDYAVVLLVGLPQLNNQLRLSSHEPLRQRIIMSHNLENLNEEEAKRYIKE